MIKNLPGWANQTFSSVTPAWPEPTCNWRQRHKTSSLNHDKQNSGSVAATSRGEVGPKQRCSVCQTLVFLGAGHESFSNGRNRGRLKRHGGPLQRNLQHFIHSLYKMDRETGENLLRDFR